MVNIRSTWEPAPGILRTNLSGTVTTADVTRWRDDLQLELAKIPDGAAFRLLLNLVGFEPATLDAHKAMRTVIPEILARHGLQPAFLDLFEEQSDIAITTSRGVRCIAFANVHHDETKMTSYEQRIGTPNQRFFTYVSAAEAWLQHARFIPHPER